VWTVVAIVSFDGVGRALAVAATYLGLATIEGQINLAARKRIVRRV
jgi:hypothetical protein